MSNSNQSARITPPHTAPHTATILNWNAHLDELSLNNILNQSSAAFS